MCTLKLYVHICQRATLPPATFMINLDSSLVKNSEKEIMTKIEGSLTTMEIR